MKVKDIFTIELNNINLGEGVYESSVMGEYKTADEAIEVAKEALCKYVLYEGVVEATVYAGEWLDENSNVFGEPYDIWTGTNMCPTESARAREHAGYSRLYVDYFVQDPKVNWKYTEFNGERYKSALIPSPLIDVKGQDLLFVENTVNGMIVGLNGCPCGPEEAAFDSNVYGYVPVGWFDLPESKFIKLIKENFY